MDVFLVLVHLCRGGDHRIFDLTKAQVREVSLDDLQSGNVDTKRVLISDFIRL